MGLRMKNENLVILGDDTCSWNILKLELDSKMGKTVIGSLCTEHS